MQVPNDETNLVCVGVRAAFARHNVTDISTCDTLDGPSVWSLMVDAEGWGVGDQLGRAGRAVALSNIVSNIAVANMLLGPLGCVAVRLRVS